MKKILCWTFLVVFVMASAFLVAGCSSAPQYDSMEAFLAGEEMQSQIAADKSALEGQRLKSDVTSQGNQLIYSYTYAQALDVETAKEILKEGMEAEQEAFQNIAKSVKEAVTIENPVVVVRYLNPDGTVIYSQEFTGE